MAQDKWSRWLNEERWGDYREALQASLNTVRDHILDLAGLRSGERVLDLGAGTGFLGLEAARRVGREGTTLCLDISRDALRIGLGQMSDVDAGFIVGDVRHIPIKDESADAVVMRSVLIYVEDRMQAASEIACILRPGGRLADFEPINRRMPLFVQPPGFDDVRTAWEASLDGNPLTDFEEDDLQTAFTAAGFKRVELEPTESRWPANGKTWAHGMRHGAPPGYSGYDSLVIGGLSPQRVDEFIAAGERHLGDQWRLMTCPAVYLTGVR